METLRISISMALMFSVPTVVKCCMMPARMASLSLCCFLHPPTVQKAANVKIATANRFISMSIFPDLQSITHEEGDANVQNGKNSEGITKWAVDDVPKLKDALRSAEKGDALGQ